MPLRKQKNRHVRLDRKRFLASFQKALSFLTKEMRARAISPRRVALEAFRLYAESLPSHERKPSWFSFKGRVSGKSTDEAVMRLMSAYDVSKSKRTAIDRAGVLAAFRRSVRELCAIAAPVRPLPVIQRAQEIYAATVGEGSSKEPSFGHLVYGKKADPVVVRLLEEAGVRKRRRR